MENRTFYNEILTDHNLHPLHKEKLPDANLVLEGVNPSCGDDIILQLKVEDGQVVDGAFEGSGCAISQASADIMLDLIIGKSEEEARHLADLFLRMIKGEASENEIGELEEAGALVDVSHMPARVKCAVLGWHTMEEMLDKKTRNKREDKKKRELFFWECQGGTYHFRSDDLYTRNSLEKKEKSDVLVKNIYKNRLAKTKHV